MQRAPPLGPLHLRQVRGLGDNSGTRYEKVKSVFVCQVRQVDLARERQRDLASGYFPICL